MASWLTFRVRVVGLFNCGKEAFVATKMSIRVLPLLVLQCLLAIGMEAQTNTCKAYFQYCSGDPLIPGATYTHEGPCLDIGQVGTYRCKAICWDCLFGTPN